MPHRPSIYRRWKNCQSKSQILERYIKDKTKSMENIRITFKASENMSEMIKSLVTFGTVSVDREMLFLQESSVKETSVTCSDMLSYTPTLVRDFNTPGNTITGVAFLQDGRLLISKYDSKLLELWDDNCALISSLALPGTSLWDTDDESHRRHSSYMEKSAALLQDRQQHSQWSQESSSSSSIWLSLSQREILHR